MLCRCWQHEAYYTAVAGEEVRVCWCAGDGRVRGQYKTSSRLVPSPHFPEQENLSLCGDTLVGARRAERNGAYLRREKQLW